MKMGEGPNDKGLSRAHIVDGVHACLRRLDTEYMDLLQVHAWDAETPIEETMRALDDLVRDGKVRYIGCSNFTAWQLVWSLWASDRHNLAAFVSVQPRYSLVDRSIEKELLPACQQFGVGIIPYSPLAGGVLTGKYEEGKEPPPGTRAHGNDRFGNQHGTHRNFEIARRASSGRNRAATPSANSPSPGSSPTRKSPASSPASQSPSRSKRMRRPPHGN